MEFSVLEVVDEFPYTERQIRYWITKGVLRAVFRDKFCMIHHNDILVLYCMKFFREKQGLTFKKASVLIEKLYKFLDNTGVDLLENNLMVDLEENFTAFTGDYCIGSVRRIPRRKNYFGDLMYSGETGELLYEPLVIDTAIGGRELLHKIGTAKLKREGRHGK